MTSEQLNQIFTKCIARLRRNVADIEGIVPQSSISRINIPRLEKYEGRTTPAFEGWGNWTMWTMRSLVFYWAGVKSCTATKALEDLEILANVVMANKSTEYGLGDRLHNFKAGYEVAGLRATDVACGYALKHAISVHDLSDGRLPMSNHMLCEKVGDMFNYCILILACAYEDTYQENMDNLDRILAESL